MSIELVQKTLGEMTEAHKAAMASNSEQMAELKGRLNATEQEVVEMRSKGVRGGQAVSSSDATRQKISEAFAAKSAELKELRKNPRMAVSIDTGVSVKEFIGLTPGSNSPDGAYPSIPTFKPGIIDLQKPITVIDSLPHQPIGTNLYEFTRFVPSLSTDASGPVAQGAAKGQTEYHFERASTAPVTVAHIAKFSQQLADDTTVLSVFAPAKMRQQLLVKMDAQILNGSGSGENLTGLFTQAGSSATGGYSLSNDKVNYAVAAMLDAGYFPTLIVANPLDVLAIRSVKDTTGQYLQYNQFLGNLQLVESPNVTLGTMLIVSSGALDVLDRTSVSFLVAYDADDFSKNLLTARCEARIGLAVYDEGAIRKVAI